MSHSTHPITYVYDVEGHTIEVTRHHIGTAYARNGNVGNPTEYFRWSSRVDGELPVVYRAVSRAEAYEHARAKVLGVEYRNDDLRRRYVNVRPYTEVQREMKANYNSRRAS